MGLRAVERELMGEMAGIVVPLGVIITGGVGMVPEEARPTEYNYQKIRRDRDRGEREKRGDL